MTETKQQEKKFKALSISRVTQDIKEGFAQLAIASNKTQSQLFTLIFNNYKNLNVEFNEEEIALIQQAKDTAPNTFKKKLKRGILRYANDAINMKDLPEASSVDINKKNSARAADVRADTLITKIFEHNELAENWYDKILLTKSSILDYVEKQKILEPDTICIGKVVLDRCLERNKELIERHHEKQGLKSNHNVKAYYERLKITKGDKL